MKIVIIEDEKWTAEDLADTIIQIEPHSQIVAVLQSVKESIAYFKDNAVPDVIFSDIQLGDGLSFEIFSAISITTPVIFCTAFDDYALNAFKANGIEYMLKPFTLESVQAALGKFHTLRNTSPNADYFQSFIKEITSQNRPKSAAILVYYKDVILPVKVNDIALFYVENENTHLVTFDNKTYYPKNNLDELERMTGNDFFRANRKCLINRKSVVNASSYLSRKLSVKVSIPFDHIITISKEKTPHFLAWLAGN
ncbi:LytR/AlgR family response regulator transcription factor [Dyadobacter psychrotolerans]|uniref:Response regulator transcription factor n=1 Tax=Dyadobacter psychrotolerans TaxID=2541721 RepID=A0A4R5DN38_9BACT|nr:LytTR family DNA-binding domain-containing protein [Dyadobacter psychrotolerans]TDE15599.1 response regulator transcription factor [Dyadobacter psychrotolerans]